MFKISREDWKIDTLNTNIRARTAEVGKRYKRPRRSDRGPARGNVAKGQRVWINTGETIEKPWGKGGGVKGSIQSKNRRWFNNYQPEKRFRRISHRIQC